MTALFQPLAALSSRMPVALAALIAGAAAASEVPEVAGYAPGVREIRFLSPADGSEQPALFRAPELAPGEKAPLLVALHSWSGNYRQAGGESKYAEWCARMGWIFLHPDFRGPNRTPAAMGSDLMVSDIEAAVAHAVTLAAVDEDRIYAVGGSGGGHAALLLAGRLPGLWAAVSAWCPITDIAAWHAETLASGRANYARDIEGALGGPPDTTGRIAEAWRRSPLAWLDQAAPIPVDINHGIEDGRAGSVPFTHSLRAWDVLAPADSRLGEEAVAAFYRDQEPPAGLGAPEPDPLYGNRPPVFRLVSGQTRLTIFQGKHEILHQPALNWLAAQRKGQPANWNPPRVADIHASDAEKESGK